MSISRTAIAAVFLASALVAPISANALPFDPGLGLPSDIEHVAQGCGPGGWRGPYGGCNYAPGGRWGWGSHWGCPPGWWRGPWGHCRHTTYHGRLPGGGWK
ncbi:GCG_CRPN prefix-to-repeats domain-containing protein [Methyloferula stellata]|jgi:hypothetical protein|uniref:GCG_CRPN prefix-to-repeats domain-containing protein n=1 Tax=Methyloferula stellata TaxID=876270 RepID=UPI000368EB84|nr:hypothetical protein [Methyloferula stellata]